ncbi:Protein CBR-RNP-8.1 [Caenorhabditis briggsae]|uniref:RRM domain-containing protein n=3 Tax=Caenorhabditis briggsae TaxID=6238 RepID=A0AAE9IWT0_CAEBR|nr:Protein CBR-RNP-8.1 [Caenorhabditis briggsae]ULU08403.1 hypothetical protein L3Y34_019528 [Caenorhabditis briggsae]CAP38587.2 Protein CBR-RNP-8.1 [Caenorhabditis briggsae]
MNGQTERCDRTAYVSGLQSTVSDIELFEVFNRVAHVEKVIVRSGTIRHALVVFKTVEGLYEVLNNFQGTSLHGRQLHIRPLRESSHSGNGGGGRVQKPYRPSAAQNSTCTYRQHPASYQPNPRGFRNSSGSTSSFNGGGGANGRRRNQGYVQNGRGGFQNETYSGAMSTLFNAYPQYGGFHQPAAHHHQTQHDFHFENHAEGAKRFDNLANLIRATTPTDPFGAKFLKSTEKSQATSPTGSRSRASSAKEHKQAPPAWKMELRLADSQNIPPPPTTTPKALSMTQHEFLAQIARQAAQEQQEDVVLVGGEEGKKKQRPILSVINPSLFYEQYPRTSSPVVFAPNSIPNTDKNPSPHDPAVVAYSRLRIPPQSAFDHLSPIDTNNCSFITKHLGPNDHQKRDFTNEELSDMIVSTGNLRMNPMIQDAAASEASPPIHDETPAPWSPLKRVRAESGSLSAAPLASPQFSPIKPKCEEFDTADDDVFGGSGMDPQKSENVEKMDVKQQQKMSDFEDINNSRLPSNSHSAAPSSDQKSFVFPPEYPMCRHSSVPSIAHLVGDLSDFCPPSPHLTEKLAIEEDVENPEDVDKTSDDKSSSSKADDVAVVPGATGIQKSDVIV